MIVLISGPYSDPSPEANTDRAMALALRLRDLGYTPHVPQLNHFLNRACPRPYEFWVDWSLDAIQSLAAMNRVGPPSFVVLRMPGESPGADRQVGLATSLDVPVCYRVKDLVRQFPPPAKTLKVTQLGSSHGAVPERPVRKPGREAERPNGSDGPPRGVGEDPGRREQPARNVG